MLLLHYNAMEEEVLHQQPFQYGLLMVEFMDPMEHITLIIITTLELEPITIIIRFRHLILLMDPAVWDHQRLLRCRGS